jgi:hypothetical protein
MRFILGFIVGVVLTIVGAYIHDSLEAGTAKPLVNWTNVADLEQASYDYVKAQFDRLVKWATSN